MFVLIFLGKGMLKAFLIKSLLSLNKMFRFLGCTEEGKVGYLEGGYWRPHEVLDLPNLPGVTALDMVYTLWMLP